MVLSIIVLVIKKWKKIWMMGLFMDMGVIIIFLAHKSSYQSFAVAYANSFHFLIGNITFFVKNFSPCTLDVY
jgi:hypothetical protein